MLKKENRDIWEERVRDAELRENEGGTSNASWSDPFPPFAVTAVQQGMEERWLQQGDWQREMPFLLALAVRAFPSVTDVPLKSPVLPHLASSHLSVEQGLQKPPSTQAAWPAASAWFVQGPSTGPADTAVFQLGCGNKLC